MESENLMKVKPNTLLLFACFVWSAAGANILHIGIESYAGYLSVINVGLSVLIFALFEAFVFWKLVKKHTKRIQSYLQERQFFLNFFDRKAFVIMAAMISGGIIVRQSGIASQRAIAVFYSGLGAALLMAGILFGCNYGKAIFSDAVVQK